jgi:hypothetical protein
MKAPSGAGLEVMADTIRSTSNKKSPAKVGRSWVKNGQLWA